MTITAQYISVVSGGGQREANLFEATLFDPDLIRGDDAGERVESSDGFDIFNGFFRFLPDGRVLDDGEVETTVTFADGTVLEGVLGLRDSFSGYLSTNLYLLDQSALAAAGQTMADVVDIQTTAFVDHDLSWAELGFGGGSAPAPAPDPAPDPAPEPTPEPTPEPLPEPLPEPEPEPLPEPDTVINIGTGGRDRLVGTAQNDVFIAGAGSDRMTGNGGADTFVFGADARDGARDRDVITDFDPTNDVIVLEQGASVRQIFERNGDTFVQLNGDRDTIVLRDVDASTLGEIVTLDDGFLG